MSDSAIQTPSAIRAITRKIDLPRKTNLPLSIAVLTLGIAITCSFTLGQRNDPEAARVFLVIGALLSIGGAVYLYLVLTLKPWMLAVHEHGVSFEQGAVRRTCLWSDISELKIFVANRPMINCHIVSPATKTLKLFLIDGIDSEILAGLCQSVQNTTYWTTLTRQVSPRQAAGSDRCS